MMADRIHRRVYAAGVPLRGASNWRGKVLGHLLRTPMPSAIAAGGVFLLAMLAPFETTAPLVRLPWQSLSNLEAALLAACVLWGAALVSSASLPSRDVPLALAWTLFVAAMAVASLRAPIERVNAWHMTGRLCAAAAVYLLTVSGITTPRRLRIALTVALTAGVIVAVLAVLEYVRVGPVLRLLSNFRPYATAVGAQVRAGGTLQYPTIASMYLEVVFAFGLGLMLASLDSAKTAAAAVCFVALTTIGGAITLTFTRAGLLTMAVSLVLVGALRWRRRSADRGTALLAALGVAVALVFLWSRPSESLWLRLTSEGQDAWYRANIDAPVSLAFAAGRQQYVPVTVANTGRLAWDSQADPPILFSYHWLDEDGARVVAYDGGRTPFPAAVEPGGSATLHALVRAPGRPGRYRLEWDVVQEGRLWFSTEQDAPEPFVSSAVVEGVPVGPPIVTTPRPSRSVRPGRLVLWRTAAAMIAAHPILGVGPDNFRLLYGSYSGLAGADTRTHTNNMYLEVLVGGGVVALAAFAWFLRSAYALFASAAGGPGPSSLGAGIAAAGAAIGLHGVVDSFLSFAPTYILFALTLGFAAAVARGVERPVDAHRV
jgi:O-antigen ligase